MKKFIKFLVVLFFLNLSILTLSGTVFGATLDVSVGTNDVTYKPSDKVTVSGYVRYPTTSMPVSSSNVLVYVDGTLVEQVTTDSTGAFSATPFSAGSVGTHTVQISAIKGSDSGAVYGSYRVEEYEKRYTITTDKFSYSPGENVSISILVENVLSNGTLVPVKTKVVYYKIKMKNGTLAQDTTPLITDSTGTASTTYTIAQGGYGDYIISVGNGAAIGVFKVPPFSIRVATLGSDGTERYVYGTSDNLIIRTTVTRELRELNRTEAVHGATIAAYIKDASGNSKKTLTNFTESSSGGIYNSEIYSLENLTNGEYYIDVDVTAGGKTQTSRVWFEVQSLRIDLVPIGEKHHVIGFLRNSNVSLGLFVMNMRTGEEISGDQILSASIVDCRDERFKSCMSKLSNNGSLESGLLEFSRVLEFQALNETGEFLIKARVRVNTSNGQTLSGIGETYISVQNIITYAETKDEFDNWRWDYGPGEMVKAHVYAYGQNWEEKNISSIQVVDVRNDKWNNVSSRISPSIDLTTNTVSFNAPSTPGFYHIKLKITTTDGDVGYAGVNFQVRLYKISVDTVNSASNNAIWQWKFGSDSTVYFRVNLYDLSDTRVSSSNYNVQLSALVNEMTGKRYSGLTTTELSADDQDRLGISVNLSNQNLASGFYRAEIKITDIDGNTAYGEAWFKISNLDVSVDVKDTLGNWKWQFSPSENITFNVSASYFNGTPVPDGSNASIEQLLMMKEGPPISVSTSMYNKSEKISLTNGNGLLWLKAQQGKTLSQGNYMVIIKVTTPEGTSDRQESWFDIRLINVNSYADPWSTSPSSNVTIRVGVTKTDGTALGNATVELYKLRNTQTWTEVSLPNSQPQNTSSEGKTTITFPASGLNGEYEAELKINSIELGATSYAHTWFSVKKYQISGWLVDGSRDTFAPGKTVELWVQVKHANSTWNNPQYVPNANVTVYKFANTENWPWSYITSVDMVKTGTTDSQGKALIKFKAPSTTGRYNPLIQVTVPGGDTYNSTSPWDTSSFNVRSVSAVVTLYDNTSGQMVERDIFGAGKNVTVEINVSNPSGGEVNISSISLKYRRVSSGEETPLQTLSYNLGSNNYVRFASPTSEGDYVLEVTVTDGSTGKPLPVIKRWFNVQSFDLRFWVDSWSYGPGQNVTINLAALSPDGSPANFSVNVTEVRNSWDWSLVSTTTEGEKTISGSGSYKITAPSNLGEYDVSLCTYPVGESCSSNSNKVWLHFAVETFRIDTWSEQGSYTTDQNVTLNVELRHANGTIISPSNYNVTFVELRDSQTGTNKTYLITVPTIANNRIVDSGDIKNVKISAQNLTKGEYIAKLNITYQGESNLRDAWFKISDALIRVKTLELINGHNREKWFVGENITLNITISPSQNTTGTLLLKDDYSWNTLNIYDLTLANGEQLINVSVDTAGRYTVLVQVGNSEAHYSFDAGMYDIQIKDWLSTHELKPSENVTVFFNVLLPNGSEYYGPVNITILKLHNPGDWSTVSGTENLFNTSINAGTGDESFSFAHGRTSGEYEAEILFEIGGKKQKEGFWFMVKSNIFEVKTSQRSYFPGDNVSLEAFVAHPNRTAIENVNVKILDVRYEQDWSIVPITNLTMSANTSSDGRATLNFTLPQNGTGRLEVKLRANNSQIAFVSFTVNGYNAWVERAVDKWSYTPGENFTGTLYVYDSDNNPKANLSVNIKVRRENWNFVNSVDLNGITGENGNFSININLDPGNFTPGHYMLEATVAGGAATVTDVWFEVKTFNTKVVVMKEDSQTQSLVYDDQFTSNDTVVVRLEVLDSSWDLINTAVNASLQSIKNDITWTDETSNIQNVIDTTEPVPGTAQVKFKPVNLSPGNYIARINVTANVSGVVSSNLVDAWFRVSPYTVNINFVCPEGSSDRCDPRRAYSGGNLTARVNITGSYSSFNVCLDRVRNLGNGVETLYGICTSNLSEPITFTSPTEQADYDAIFTITVDNQPIGDVSEWFRVGGEYNMNTWVEPRNAWAGDNATLWVEIWGPNWENYNESKCSIDLTELRDARNWDHIIDTNLTEWNLGSSNDPYAPPAARVGFTVPNIGAGEYSVKINANCEGNVITGEVWFRVVVFQVSSLLNEKLKSNESAKMWLKVTRGNGTPIKGANFTLSKLVDSWSWTTIQTFDQKSVTDSNGEVTVSFTTPTTPGEYMLVGKIEYEGIEQEIERWFQIRPIDVKIKTSKDVFFVGDNVTLFINVTNPMNGSSPVFNASVEVDLHKFIKGPGGGGDKHYSIQTNASGIAILSLNTTENNLTSGDYETNINVNTEAGWAWGMKTILVRKYNISVSGAKAEYGAGDNVSFVVSVRDSQGSIPGGLGNMTVAGLIKAMSFGSGNETNLDSDLKMLNDSGMASFTLTIPSNTSSGPTALIVRLKNGSSLNTSTIDDEEFMFIVHGTGASLNLTNLNESGVNGNEFIDVNISSSDPTLAMAPFIRHLEKSGNAVPMSQLMSGGPESGKESWYENPIYLEDGFAHIKVLAQKQSGDYVIMVPFIEKGFGWMGAESFQEIGKMDYKVN